MKFNLTITLGDCLKIVSIVAVGTLWFSSVNNRLGNQDEKIAGLITATSNLNQSLVAEKDESQARYNEFTALKTVVSDRINLKP